MSKMRQISAFDFMCDSQMLSRLRKGLMYTDTDPDVLDHDDDLDAELFTYDKRQVYRGRYDPRYTKEDLDVHWLYDDNGKRVGLVEYESADFSISSILWYRNNPYATMFQDDSWVSQDKTLWSLLSNEAYQDCLEDDFKTVIERSLGGPYHLVFPSTIGNPYEYYQCEKCGKKTLSLDGNCPTVKKRTPSSYSSLFLDDSFILYSHLPSKERAPHDAYAPSSEAQEAQAQQTHRRSPESQPLERDRLQPLELTPPPPRSPLHRPPPESSR